jgi:hypothetical protein
MHGELHYTLPEEFDRRVSLISFDNAIEASIACYLKLHPTQRGNREYQKEKVKKTLDGSFHDKVGFFYEEITLRSENCRIIKQEVFYVHTQRNLFYHESPDFVPSNATLRKARDIAFWVFSFLFEIPDLEAEIDERIKQIRNLEAYSRNEEVDKILDEQYQEIEILGYPYKLSDVLFAVDPTNYQEFVAGALQAGKEFSSGEQNGN